MNKKQLTNFISKIEHDNLTGCWLWKAQLSKDGYAKFQIGRKNVMAHRVSYEHWVEEIKEGLEIDHLCRNRNCVFPDHLETVTHSENMKRSPVGKVNNWNLSKTHCKNGHPFSGDNLFYEKRGGRRCKICCSINQKKSRLKRKLRSVQ